MKYRKLKRYKYILEENISFNTEIYGYEFSCKYFKLAKDGILTVFKGYIWDGVSGPAIDTKNTMNSGLLHDALYQSIRMKLLPLSKKKEIDILFYNELIKDGMDKFRATYFYLAVVTFGYLSCIPGNITTPRVLKV